ncbi:hypothetical protein K435DRAFT_784123 [Dendrothele bispora CBS 962.96]|uniref:Uncharacterized protein n=1 Tax=Dendrothele bispora (strain CBS 962.96) TaxID=1314807 RepID=A0A4S8L5E2_DENBC|nr:hypothetical protein K435DRAFT_784123 [Dendrothele bispora CBS 962.96]
MRDIKGDRLSGVRVGGGITAGRNKGSSEAGENEEKSDDIQLMDDESQAGSDRRKGKREGADTGMVAGSGTSRIGRYEDDGTKVGMRHESRSEAIPSIPAAGEPGVSKGSNRDTDTEQRVTDETGGEEDDTNMGSLAGVDVEALHKGDSGDDGTQAAVTGMLPTASSRGDEGPKRDKDNGNQITNDQSEGEIDRMDREGESLDTTDSPRDGSSDEAVHTGSSRGGTASGTDNAGSGQGGENQVMKASNTGNNEREERSIEDEE